MANTKKRSGLSVDKIEKKKIDIEAIKKDKNLIKELDDNSLYNDAYARGDVEALKYLHDRIVEENDRERKDKEGNKIKAFDPISKIRLEYLKKYYNYTPIKNVSVIKQRDKKKQDNDDVFNFIMSNLEK